MAKLEILQRPAYSLELTHEEAQFLFDLVGRITGPMNSRRGIGQHIHDVFRDQGFIGKRLDITGTIDFVS